ncbi:MAG: class I SAM-dependent methyltransferase [Patescibacteria group bacterium]|jgi:ubiquinone/menaquinone biosynthesis C-methylase UbiE
MPNTVYQKTRQAYNTLGRLYTAAVESLAPPERKTFAKHLTPGAHILDVGCAGGRDANFFVQQGFRLTGIDSSTVFIRIAKARVPKAVFKVMDARKILFRPQTFDAIWANAVLLHLQRKDIPRVLRHFFRILRIGGLLHVRVKIGRDSGWVTDQLAPQPRFFTYFTKAEMTSLLRTAGFRIQASQHFADESKRREVRWLSIEAVKPATKR